MSEHDKDNISQFFHKAVQKPQIRFVESDWEKLEARLDAASMAGSSKRNHWKTAFIATAVLLLITSSLLFYNGRQNSTTTEKTGLNNVNADQSLSTTGASKNEKSSSEEQYVKNAEVKKSEENSNRSSLPSNVRTKEVTPSLMKSLAKINKEAPTSLQSDITVDDTALFPQAAVSSTKVNNASDINESSDEEAASQSPPGDSSSVEEQKDHAVKNEMNLNDSLAYPLKSKPSRWNIMLSLSPDFSSTDLNKFTTPGGAFGIAAYYNVSRAFSISAGVVKSHKLYWDNGYEYKPVEPGFWGKKTNGIVPGKVEGSCSVLEIPLGLQYNLISAKKSKVYLGATFSSYIMLKESYQYIFDTPNLGAAESWNAKKVSYNLFSIANLSAGYERNISNRMMIGVSPYIKIPLSGIGAWANVKLYSVGAAFTLRYQFQKKKQPDRWIPAD
jgi:hypothetical protein